MVLILFAAAEVHFHYFSISAKRSQNANQEMRSADIPTICDR